MNKIKSRKAINFDLSVKALKIAYPKPNHRKAWDDICKFMEQNGFEHRQYSGYNSIEPMAEYDIDVLMLKMRKTFPWLANPDVIKQIDVTDIGEVQSHLQVFQGKKSREKSKSLIKKQED